MIFLRYRNIFVALGVFVLLLTGLLAYNFFQSKKIEDSLEGLLVKTNIDVSLQEIDSQNAEDLEGLRYDSRRISLDLLPSIDGDENVAPLYCNEDNECVENGSSNPSYVRGMHGFTEDAILNNNIVEINPDEEIEFDEGLNYIDLLLISGTLTAKDSYYIEGVTYIEHVNPLNFLWTQRPEKDRNIAEGQVTNKSGEVNGFYYIKVNVDESGYTGFLFVEGLNNLLELKIDLATPEIPHNVLTFEVL